MFCCQMPESDVTLPAKVVREVLVVQHLPACGWWPTVPWTGQNGLLASGAQMCVIFSQHPSQNQRQLSYANKPANGPVTCY